MTERIDIAIIGAGVVGAAVAEALAKKTRSLWVLEAGPRPADGITSRNSGVVHSGIYYKPDSLKAKTCIRGNSMLYDWCDEHNVPFQKTGKIITSITPLDSEHLNSIFKNAQASGAQGLSLLSKKEFHSLEPNLGAEAGLLCRETGIVDAPELTRSLLLAAEENGAEVVTDCHVHAIQRVSGGYVLDTARGGIEAGTVINAAGLYADDVAKMAGVEKYRIYPCRGDYFSFRPKVKYQHLLYPVKRPGDLGLGIHVTLDLAGNYRLGPDTEYVSDKEDFSSAEQKLEKFRQAAEKMLGPIDPSQLSYDTCGIRPKLRSPEEKEEKDFVIRKDLPGLINLVGIESPGLTAALAIGEMIKKMI